MPTYKTKYSDLTREEVNRYLRERRHNLNMRTHEYFAKKYHDTQGPSRPMQGPSRPVRTYTVPHRVDINRGANLHAYQDSKGVWRTLTPRQAEKVRRLQKLADDLGTGLGKVARRGPRFPLWQLWDLAGAVDDAVANFQRDGGGQANVNRKNVPPQISPLSGWYLHHSCDYGGPGPYVTAFFSSHMSVCLTKQAYESGISQYYGNPARVKGDGSMIIGPATTPFLDGVYTRFNYRTVYWRDANTKAWDDLDYARSGSSSPMEGARYGANGRASPTPSPNVMRYMARFRGQSVPTRGVSRAPEDDTIRVPYTRVDVDVVPETASGSSAPPYFPPPSTYTPHRPPTKSTKERKGMSKSKRWAVRFANAMDAISEGSEMVDAFYDALPEDVKRRWSKGREERPGDQMGQYGADGADWKIEALWHNWDKVDFNKATQNIMKNEMEDRLYGAAYGAMDDMRPRNRARRYTGRST